MFSHPMPKRLVLILGLACLLSLSVSAALAQDSAELLDQAAQQINAHDYVTAKQTLEQVKPAELSPADKDRLEHLTQKADHGLAKALGLRQSIAQADELANQKKFASADLVLANALAAAQNDPAAQSRIKVKQAQIDARQKLSTKEMKQLFAQSVKDYDAGRLAQAQQGFKAIIESQVDLGFWNRGKPQKYLQKIAEQSPAPSSEPTTIVVPSNTAPAPAPDVVIDYTLEPSTTTAQPSRTSPDYSAVPPASQSLLAEEVKRRRIITQQITMQHRLSMSQAQELVAEHKFLEARRVVNEAQAILRAHESILPVDKMAAMNSEAQARLAHIDQEQRLYQKQELEAQQARAVAVAEKALSTADQVRTGRITELLSQGATFIQERKYKLALDRYQQVLTVDPNHASARALASWLQDTTRFHESQDIDTRSDAEVYGAIRNTGEAAIPYDRDPPIVWDQNWVELSQRRLKAMANIAGDSPENIDAQNRLSVKYPRFEYQDTPLVEVFDDMREKSGLNIVPNWQSLSTAGIEQTTPVNLQLRNVSLERTLQAVLNTLSSAGYYGVTISHVLQDGVLVIANSEDLDADMHSTVYGVSDLLIEIGERRGGLRFEGGSSGSGSSRSSDRDSNRSSSSSSSSSRDSGRSSSSRRSSSSDGEGSREDMLGGILDLVMSINPDSWVETGTGQGTATIYGTKLVIYQTSEVHNKIRDMLSQIRDTRPVQISVEPRFLYVTDNFLEDIGMDLDLYLNDQGHWADPLGTGYGVTALQNSSTWAAAGATGVPGSIGAGITALSITGSFLDELEVDFVLRATQASRQATTLTAPRVTFENGGSATIYVGRETAYVSEVSTEVEENAVSYEISTEIIETGPTLNVQGVTSADNRFVRLDIEVSLYDLVDLPFLSELVPSAAIATPELALQQLPIIDTTTISTQVSVPDGGALLIGGLRQSGEESKEAGVPILSKIPYLNRWFTNKSLVVDKHVLVILLRPRIIDLKEEQGLTYPMLGEQ